VSLAGLLSRIGANSRVRMTMQQAVRLRTWRWLALLDLAIAIPAWVLLQDGATEDA